MAFEELVLKLKQEEDEQIQIITGQTVVLPIFKPNSYNVSKKTIINDHHVLDGGYKNLLTACYQGHPIEKAKETHKVIPTIGKLEGVTRKWFREDCVYKTAQIYGLYGTLNQIQLVTGMLNHYYKIIGEISDTVITLDKELITVGIRVIPEIEEKVKKCFSNRLVYEQQFLGNVPTKLYSYESNYCAKELNEMAVTIKQDTQYMLEQLKDEELVKAFTNTMHVE